MIWIILFGVFTFLASSGIAYLWWVKAREMRLRQDIFVIRDDLFDAAVDNDWLDDPCYRAFRTYLNSLLAFAHHLSVPALIHLSELPLPDEPFPESGNKRIQKAVQKATQDVSARVIRFVRFETAIGLLVEAASRMVRWAKAADEEQIAARIAPGHLPTPVFTQHDFHISHFAGSG